ncbi:MAG: ComEC/Rec2 family competence protein [Candidatus Pacebacteria bacterium]|nr:ComEC/Rec2 family competence protein [Candidatus Paceibacterota bacterium]
MLVYNVAAGICVGIASVFLFGVGAWVGVAVLVLGAGALSAGFLYRYTNWIFVALLLCGVSLGIARAELYTNSENNQTLQTYAGKETVLEGRVVNDPERRETSLHAHVLVEKVGDAEASGKLLAILARDTQINFGDRVTIKGNIVLPESFETDTGHLFDYPGYLRARGIQTLMRYGSVANVEPGSFSLRTILFSIKHTFERAIERSLPEPDASLMEGMLLGERRGIPKDLNDALIVAGLIHIVVLSGYNISIVAEQILRLFGLVARKRVALILGAAAIILFVVMVGGGATAVRAGVMGTIAILARYVNRPAVALRALAVAATGMIVWNPTTLLYDPSFILSVLATFGLITLSPSAEKFVKFFPEAFGLRSIAASTLSVQVFVLPALFYYTGIFSVWALPANLLALPTVPLAMLSGFVTGAVGLVSSFLALPFALLAHLLVEWLVLVANMAAAMPLSSFTIAAFPAWVLGLVYIPLTGFAIYSYRNAVQSHPNSNF